MIFPFPPPAFFRGYLRVGSEEKAQFALLIAITDWIRPASTSQEAESSSDGTVLTRKRQNELMVMGACPGQIPISCVPLTLMITAKMVRACRYRQFF